MDANCKIEFGEVDLKLRQTYIYDNCVEFPTSWPEKDSCQISFGFEDIVYDETSPNPNLQAQKVVQFGAPVPDEAPVCNGIYEESKESISNIASGTDMEIGVADVLDTSKNAIETIEQQPDVYEKSDEDTAQPKERQNSESGQFDHQVMELDWAEEPNDAMDKKEENLNEQQSERTTDLEFLEAKDDVCDKITDEIPSAPPAIKSSWAGLFRSKDNASTTFQTQNGKLADETANSLDPKSLSTNNNKKVKITGTKPENTVNNYKPQNQTKTHKVVTYVDMKEDTEAEMLAEKLSNLELIYKPQAFIPRGLLNVSNWCYINATLQALLACPPLFQLLKCLPLIPAEKRKQTSTPILDSFIRLASEFRPLSSKKGYQSPKDVKQGPPFEPRYMYDMLSTIKSSLSQTGRQEDAEEFQTCVLNGLHEEMTKLLNLTNSSTGVNENPALKNGGIEHENELPYEIPVYDEMVNGNGDLIDDEWEEVITTKKNRSAVTRRADITRTPISEMFRGELCTSVFRPGQKVSVSLEPFFSLPLDVPTDHPWNIEEALLSLTGKENFQPSEPNSDDASRQQTLEVLPPILIMHLKRFVYDKNGGLKKINKRMEYKTELVIQKELLSKSARKLGHNQRSYKLFAVLYHHGDKASGGHYSTDVFHIGVSSWLRIDDQSIRTVTNSEVTRHSPTRTAYLLYYRRTDLG